MKKETLGLVILLYAFLPFFCSMIIGLYNITSGYAFFASNQWRILSFHITWPYCLTLLPILAILAATAPNDEKAETETQIPQKIFLVVVAPFVIFIIMSVSLTNAIGTPVTKLIGKSCEQIVSIEKKKESGYRKGCDYKLIMFDFKNRLFAKPIWCVSKNRFEELPQTGNYHITGKRSYLGFSIENYELTDTNIPDLSHKTACY